MCVCVCSTYASALFSVNVCMYGSVGACIICFCSALCLCLCVCLLACCCFVLSICLHVRFCFALRVCPCSVECVCLRVCWGIADLVAFLGNKTGSANSDAKCPKRAWSAIVIDSYCRHHQVRDGFLRIQTQIAFHK